MLNSGRRSNGQLNQRLTNSQWFNWWTQGCETQMGYVLKQNQAISLEVLLRMVELFKSSMLKAGSQDVNVKWRCAIVCGSEGLKVNFEILQKHWLKGQTRSSTKTKGVGSAILSHVSIPILRRFNGEQGERCHLLALT